MSGDRSKIVERIRKLLALADDKGATEAEAVAAVMMAQRLMAENDVADWELHSMDEQPIPRRSPSPQRSLCRFLQKRCAKTLPKQNRRAECLKRTEPQSTSGFWSTARKRAAKNK